LNVHACGNFIQETTTMPPPYRNQLILGFLLVPDPDSRTPTEAPIVRARTGRAHTEALPKTTRIRFFRRTQIYDKVRWTRWLAAGSRRAGAGEVVWPAVNSYQEISYGSRNDLGCLAFIVFFYEIMTTNTCSAGLVFNGTLYRVVNGRPFIIYK
jgi:hypothetical protein